ncbi:PREDICTED: uncharacterized protein LOC105365923 [Ceratosolen solmsi marchali]|uniref:Uncharacterized protein LOC105365923 n=1 Tax=Ceratosolen solmsi marchali TaxID=326594 RepID=A0AAJ6YQS1_9HYME|nr:PREDICTED: uncharacterized protein LOC105365923 [Ceratosolen solmsi marchali]
MFPTFIGILDIQSWWEVPSIAHFCSLFRHAFNLLDFDIEDLEEAFLTDTGTESHLLHKLIVRLLEGCLPDDTRNDISTFNYQMFLRRLFRKKCQEYKCENPFNTDIDFELLPLRRKVEILWALCDFRLDTKDVEELLSDLDSDCLRVEPLGHDHKNSAYWYFYGTRLYREDHIKSSNFFSQKKRDKSRDKRHKRRRHKSAKKEKKETAKEENCIILKNKTKDKESIWQVVCFTLQDWNRLVEKFKDSEYATEQKLYKILSEDFMPEIPKLFDLKEKQQRRKLLQRNTITIVKTYSKEKINKSTMVKRKIKDKTKGPKNRANEISETTKSQKEIVSPPVQKKGRQTNNSLASAVGQILIDTYNEATNVENKKGPEKHGSDISSTYSYEYNFDNEEEEQQIGMHKVLKILKNHKDAWPFIDPVDEQYAPKYYSVVQYPMDLTTMEDKLEDGSYKTLNQFKRDFHLIVENCKQYNGSNNEYTNMVMHLTQVFDKAVDLYLESEITSNDSLPIISDRDIDLTNCKNKTSLSSIRYSQRHKHLQKLNKKVNINTKINKKKIIQIYDDFIKKDKKIGIEVLNIKKKDKKKLRSEKKIQVEENKGQENKVAISDTNVIKSKRKKGNNDRIILKNKKILKKEIDGSIKLNKKFKKEIRQDKQLFSTKELKSNRKRKDDFQDYNSISMSKSKSKKIDKKKSKELDSLIDRIRKNKNKKIESDEKSLDNNDKLFSPSRNREKSRNSNKEKLKSLYTNINKEKDKIKKRNNIKNVAHTTNSKKNEIKKCESCIINKDIEFLDGLKDKISKKPHEKIWKLERKRKKNQSLKVDNIPRISKKVPCNDSTYHQNNNKLDNTKLKFKNVNRKNKNVQNSNQNLDNSKPKKISCNIKTAYNKYTKVSERGDPTIQALNQATEQTLNDINKWLDDTPRITEFSSGSDLPVFHSLANDSFASTINKYSTMMMTSTTVLAMTTNTSSRKRPTSLKIYGHASIKPKKVQRTIDRLQPGKSKGNLLSKKLSLNESVSNNNTIICQSTIDNNQINRKPYDEPKLSLGTVLKNVDSIQLICKALVSSPNPLSNEDDDEEIINNPVTPLANIINEQSVIMKKKSVTISKNMKVEKQVNNDEIQKPKSANLNAWLKAFGTPKSKKKEGKEELSSFSVSTKKEEIFETNGLHGSQRRTSIGENSISESVSSFSHESLSSQIHRSPQQSQQPPLILPTFIPMEPQHRGAGFYQDVLSTRSSPYNSPYYTTPHFSAQLPPISSPQNSPRSPSYPSSVNFDQSIVSASLNLYSQLIPKTSFKSLSQFHSPEIQNCFPHNSSPSESQQPYTATIAVTQDQSPIYSQQPLQSHLQSSPQMQPLIPGFSQPSSQIPAGSYTQLSPLQTSLNFSQSSLQEQHSSYSQTTPQPLSSYSQLSPQPQQHSSYAQSLPQQSSFLQVSPRPSSSAYSQPSSQLSSHTAQTPRSYPQSNLVMAQSSPQTRVYSQPSPQPPTSYSGQTSPQQSLAYSQTAPKTSSSYSQLSSQQLRTYSRPLNQHMSQQSPINSVQQSSTNFLQSNQKLSQDVQDQTIHFTKNSEDYIQNTLFTQPVKSTYLQSSVTFSTIVTKPIITKEKQSQQQLANSKNLTAPNHQIYPTTSNSQYLTTYPGNVFPTGNRVNDQVFTESSIKSKTSKLTNYETQQLIQQREVQQNQEEQVQLLDFQQNVESPYSTGFEATPYSISNIVCRPMYSNYFDTSTKNTTMNTASNDNNFTPVKKRIYNESLATVDTTQYPSQEQLSFDSVMTLAHSQSDVSAIIPNQFDGVFTNNLVDSVASNPAFARLQLGLVAHTTKDSQQLFLIPRTTTKNNSITTYGRSTTASQSELELNLLQTLQNAAAKKPNILSVTRRVSEQVPSMTKSRKNRKNKQHQQYSQHLSVGVEHQPNNISKFSQYGSANSDSIVRKQSPLDDSAFNCTTSTNAINSSVFFDKEASASATAAAYVFLDDFHNPNLSSYYSMALRQQQQHQQVQQQAQHQQIRQQVGPLSNVVQQACNKLCDQSTGRCYSGHSFLHSTQRPTVYRPPVSPYVTSHTANLDVESTAYQQYLHSLYALQPSPHHRPTWL